MLVAIDNGYWATKLYSKDQKFSILSRVEESEEITRGEGRYQIEYDGRKYLVGDDISSYEIENDKTKSLFHKILTLAALAKTTDVTASYDVVAGLPINLYTSQKDSFAEYLKTKGKEEVKINGSSKFIEIKNVKVFPQGAGTLYGMGAENYKNKRVAIIDIGGYTIDGCVFNNLNLINDSMFTEDYGTHRLFNKIAAKINSRHFLNVKEESMQDVIKNGIHKQGKALNVNTEIRDAVLDMVSMIVRKCKSFGWELDNLDVIFTGGGVKIDQIQSIIKDSIPQAIFADDSVYTNVKGFYRVGEVIYK